MENFEEKNNLLETDLSSPNIYRENIKIREIHGIFIVAIVEK